MGLVPQLYTMKTEQRNRSQAYSLFPLLLPLLIKSSTSATRNFPFLLFLQLLISPCRQNVCNGITQKPDEILKTSPFCVPRVLPRRESLVKKWIITSLFGSYLCESLYHNKSPHLLSDHNEDRDKNYRFECP